jgi:gamma-glutamyltranspeptidase / glutathione hydrolase
MRLRAVLGLVLLLGGCASKLPASSVPPAAGRLAMVATEQREATRAGVEVLTRGGNAVDAAVAVAYALAVVDPCCGNIGGGGFMLLRRHDGFERFIDFREQAPRRATRDMYLDARGNVVAQRSRRGWLAVGVPGTVAGIETARREYGTMSRAALMAPAIRLARNGFRLQAGDVIGRSYTPGQAFRQPQLAHTLELIAAGGADAFYRGPIARAVVAASRAGGGVLSLDDFAQYRVEESAPLHCSYHDYEISSAPPPSSGGVTLCEILNVIEPYPLASWGWHSARSLHYITEAERRAYADRNTYLGDPDFVTDPVSQLLSASYAARLRAQIDPERATPSADVRPGLGLADRGDRETTHYSIVDRWGNAVAVTYTLNDWFGAGVIAGATGFYLNDEMDDFTAKPGVPNMYGLVQGERNDVQPRKRPLSSMAPTIVTKDGKLVMVTGSPGGSRIITIVLETLLDSLIYGMNAQQAVDAPRTHMQWLPDRLEYEPGALSVRTADALSAMGYSLRQIPQWGSAQVVTVDPQTGWRYGGSDRRRPNGAAIGY